MCSVQGTCKGLVAHNRNGEHLIPTRLLIFYNLGKNDELYTVNQQAFANVLALEWCNDHSSYRVDRVPIDFHEYICVDT